MQLDFSLRQLHWWTQGCSSRVLDAHRRERYQVLQRFAWGVKVEVYDESTVLQARLRERLPFGNTFEFTLFDHAQAPRLTSTIQHVLGRPRQFELSDGRRVVIRDETNVVTIGCAEMLLRFERFDTLSADHHWAYGHLTGSNVDDEALAMALLLPVISDRASD